MRPLIGGADPGRAHYVVSVRYLVRQPDGSREDPKVQRERSQRERAALKALGIKETTYFQFRVGDDREKADAKAAAETHAALIEKEAGVTMEVAEGCFL